jgi:hypothetical protein
MPPLEMVLYSVVNVKRLKLTVRDGLPADLEGSYALFQIEECLQHFTDTGREASKLRI